MAVLTNSLLDDKKEALTESNIIPITQQDDNKVEPEPSIDTLNKHNYLVKNNDFFQNFLYNNAYDFLNTCAI